MPRRTRAYTQWTADTEIAFVMALRFHGRARRAAAEIGRTVAGAYLRRNRQPEFAAKWEEALDQWRRANARDARNVAGLDDDSAASNPPHFDGWTPIRRRAFLRALGETGKVEDACRHVRLTEAGAYALRRRDPAFAAAWDRALAQSVATLEQAAFERAVEGIEEAVWHAGKLVGTRRRYSDALLGRMMAREDKKVAGETKAAAAAPAPRATKEETDAAILKKLAAIEGRMKREASALAERLLEAGVCP